MKGRLTYYGVTHLIIDDIRPRDVRRHLQDSGVALFAVEHERVPETFERSEGVVQPAKNDEIKSRRVVFRETYMTVGELESAGMGGENEFKSKFHAVVLIARIKTKKRNMMVALMVNIDHPQVASRNSESSRICFLHWTAFVGSE